MKKYALILLLIFSVLFTGCSKGPKKSETLAWFNTTYATITTANKGNISLYGGYEKNESNTALLKSGLENSWDITDKASADETMKWLTEDGGHNAELLDVYDTNGLSDFSRDELVDTVSDPSYTDNDKAYYLGIYDAVSSYGDNAITAWDLSRAIQLCSWYYIADYYTYEEALDKSLEIAQKLQKTYDSWEDMMQSYFYGYQYWNEDDLNDESSSSYVRYQLYQDLKQQKDTPYSLDWNLKLEKDW